MKERKSKGGKGSGVRRFFRPHRKGGGKGKKSETSTVKEEGQVTAGELSRTQGGPEAVDDSLHPLGPHDPPLLLLADKQTSAPLDLEASQSRSRTHSDASETPTIACPEHHEPQRQIGQEGSSAQEEQTAVPQAASRSSSVALTEFYSDIAHALGRAQAQAGDPQDYDFWNKMRQHSLVL